MSTPGHRPGFLSGSPLHRRYAPQGFKPLILLGIGKALQNPTFTTSLYQLCERLSSLQIRITAKVISLLNLAFVPFQA